MKLTLYRPTQSFWIGQHFGESLACVNNNYPNDKTVVAKVGGVCPVGTEELYPLLGLKGHPGLDCYAPTDTPLFACTDGNVVAVSLEFERGLGVDVVTKYESDVDGKPVYVKWRYWHLGKLMVKLGDTIKIGDFIGLADSTGLSAGSHLHWECKIVYWDGLKWVNKEQGNGYYGAFDFEKYITEINALDWKIALNGLSLPTGFNSLKKLVDLLVKFFSK